VRFLERSTDAVTLSPYPTLLISPESRPHGVQAAVLSTDIDLPLMRVVLARRGGSPRHG